MTPEVVIPIRRVTSSCSEVCRIFERVQFDEECIRDLAKKLEAMSHPLRVKIVLLLRKHRELVACELENALGIPQSKLSYHLDVLMSGGVIKRRSYGPYSFYSLSDSDDMGKFLELLPAE